jgi:hypothetical protein
MKYATATIECVPSFDSALFSGDYRRLARTIGSNLVMAAAALAAVIALGVVVTVTAAWIVNSALVTGPSTNMKSFSGPGTLALATGDPVLARTAAASFEAKWAQVSAGAVPLLPQQAEIQQPARQIAAAPVVKQVAALAPAPVVPLPMPRPHPVQIEIAQAPVAPKVAPKAPPPIVVHVAAATPKPPATNAEPRMAVLEPPNKSAGLPEPDGRTAIYDISARAVYLPNGDKLEAHSGLYDKMDDPRYVSVKMRGPTPPNVYELTLREKLFHGVQAIRLNPVDERKMFGRDGILAHTYMLGPNGQSNGCVSFKDYDKFLLAFQRGEVDRLIVVPEGGTKLALAARAHRGQPGRFAANNPNAASNPNTW